MRSCPNPDIRLLPSMSKTVPLKNVLVAGAGGMVGSSICRALARTKTPYFGATRQDADLTDRNDVDQLLASRTFDAVVIAAARVGGIHANNTYPADFLYDNLLIETNLIDGAFRHGISRLLFLGSSCIYPKEAPQPMQEASLLTGPLEPTNEPYAIAKIAGIKLCESYNRQHGTDFRSLMPTNLYGPGDNFHPENSHVIPALIDRFHRAKLEQTNEVSVWGSGNPRREFLFVDDLADAAVHVLSMDPKAFAAKVDPRCSHVNVGTGEDVRIGDLAHLVRDVVGLQAELRFDSSMPDGTTRKLLDISLIRELGWAPKVGLKEGLEMAYAWYLANLEELRRA